MPLRWTARQLSGVWSGVLSYGRNFRLDDVLLPSIVSTVNWLLSLIPKALGLRGATPKQQIDANLVFIAFWAGASFVTLGATLVMVFVHLGLLGIAVVRWTPAFGNAWNWFTDRLPFNRDIDIPLWRSE